MTTKVYTLNFNAPGSLPLPQGVFFLIKTASAALNIEVQRRNAQSDSVEGVGAGTEYKTIDGGKWTNLIVTSAAIQVVEILISDAAEVRFSNTVTVSGGVSNSETPSAAIATPARITRATAGASTIAANAARRRITIANPSDNATPGLLYVQAVGAGAGRGIPLDTGMYVEVKTTAAIDVRNDSGVSVDFTQFEES